MKKSFFTFIFLLLICFYLCSCGSAPRVESNIIGNLEKAVQANKVVIVSSVGRHTGWRFREYFIDKLNRLTQDSQKRLSIMSDFNYESLRYSNPEAESSFANTLFVYINVLDSEAGEYGEYEMKYILEVKFLGQDPMLSQEITLGIGNEYFGTKYERAIQLAQTVFDELSNRKIL
jgi:hypothetical protein